MDFSSEKLLTRRNIIGLLVLAIMLLVIPVGVRLAQERQQLQSQAVGEEVIFKGDGVTKDSNGNYTTTTPNFKIQVTSPLSAPQ